MFNAIHDMGILSRLKRAVIEEIKGVQDWESSVTLFIRSLTGGGATNPVEILKKNMRLRNVER